MRRTAVSAQTSTKHLLRDLTGRRHISLTGRAAAGIWAALRAWGFTDRTILLPANTCYIVLWAVLKSGNHPLLIDIDPQTGNIDLQKLPDTTQASDTPNHVSHPAVIIPCHMYGLGASMRTICAWAQAHDVKVIEDAALAVGAVVDGQHAGTWGDASVFSFGLGKVIDNQTGGALVTDDRALGEEVDNLLANEPLWDERLMTLTNQWHGIYWPLHQYEAANPRLLNLYPELYAIYGDITLYRLGADDWGDVPKMLRNLADNIAHRGRLSAIYDSLLNQHETATLARPDGSIVWKYPLVVPPEVRDDLLTHLWESGIHECTRWYPPLRRMASVLAPGVTQAPTPGADRLGAAIINLPVGAEVSEADAQRVADVITTYFRKLN